MRKAIEITIGILFIVAIGYMLISVWSDNSSWTYPEDETPLYPEQSIL